MNFLEIKIGQEFELNGIKYIKQDDTHALNTSTKVSSYLDADTDLEILEKERAKFEEIKQNFPKAFLFARFETEQLLEKLKEFGLNHSWTKEKMKNHEKECAAEDYLDYNICVSINEDWGYIDIYYLYDLRGQMVITEITISDE